MRPRFWERPGVYGRNITFEQLEDRIVLDAAENPATKDNTDHLTSDSVNQGAQTGVPTAPAASSAAPPSAAQGSSSDAKLGQVVDQDLKVVLVANDLNEVEAISKAAVEGAKVIVFDAARDDLASVVAKLEQLADAAGKKIGTLAIVGHGDEGVLTVGTDVIDIFNLSSYLPTFRILADDLTEHSQIQFYGCSTAGNLMGQAMLNRIGLYAGADVFASVDATGGLTGNWVLEYSSDGTAAVHGLLDGDRLGHGTAPLGLNNFTNDPLGIEDLTTVGKRLYFLADDPSDTSYDKFIWWTDILGSDPVKVEVANARMFNLLTGFDGKLIFTAEHDTYGWEFFVYDPAAGTSKVFDIRTGPSGSVVTEVTELNGKLYFGASVGDLVSDSGLFQYDPDAGSDGMGKVTEVVAPGSSDHFGAGDKMVAVQGELFFQGPSWDVWKCDPDGGVGGGPIFVAITDRPDLPHNLRLETLTESGGSLFFSYEYGGHLYEYSPSTGLVAEVMCPSDDPFQPLVPVSFWGTELTDVASKLFFFAMGDIWTYRPGAAAASPVFGEECPVSPSHPFAYGDLLIFHGYDSAHGTELWRSDGTAGGTFMLKDINTQWTIDDPDDPSTWQPGSSVGYNDSAARYDFYSLVYDGYFMFTADDGGAAYGKELWRTDGTQAGTVLALDVFPGPAGSNPAYFSKVNPLFFVADSGPGTTGVFSWIVPPVVPPAPGAPPTPSIAPGPSLIFSGDSGFIEEMSGLAIPGSRGDHHGTSHAVDPGQLGEYKQHFGGADVELRELLGADWYWEHLLAWLGNPGSGAADAGSHGSGMPLKPLHTDLFGYTENVQEGAALVIDLDHIRVSSLVLDAHVSGLKLPWIDTPEGLGDRGQLDIDWMRIIDETCRNCTGSLGLVDLLLQTKPVWVGKERTI